MAKRDYYEVLGVDKSASADEIKKAYQQKINNKQKETKKSTQKIKKKGKKDERAKKLPTKRNRPANAIHRNVSKNAKKRNNNISSPAGTLRQTSTSAGLP